MNLHLLKLLGLTFQILLLIYLINTTKENYVFSQEERIMLPINHSIKAENFILYPPYNYIDIFQSTPIPYIINDTTFNKQPILNNPSFTVTNSTITFQKDVIFATDFNTNTIINQSTSIPELKIMQGH